MEENKKHKIKQKVSSSDIDDIQSECLSLSVSQVLSFLFKSAEGVPNELGF